MTKNTLGTILGVIVAVILAWVLVDIVFSVFWFVAKLAIVAVVAILVFFGLRAAFARRD